MTTSNDNPWPRVPSVDSAWSYLKDYLHVGCGKVGCDPYNGILFFFPSGKQGEACTCKGAKDLVLLGLHKWWLFGLKQIHSKR